MTRIRSISEGYICLVAGTGSIGRLHVGALRRLIPDVRFVLLRRRVAHDEWSREIDAAIVDSTDAALAARPQLAVIATPSALHADLLIPLLTAGVPCYVEKPVVATRSQADRLDDWLAHAHAVPPTLCGCNLRYLPSLAALRERLNAGAVGRIVRASLQVGQWLPDWRPQSDYRASYSARPELGGGVVLDLVHELDMARWLFGEFTQVAAFGGKFSGLEIDSDDVAGVLLARPEGPVVTIGMDYVARRPMRRYEIIGERGTLVWDLPGCELRVEDAQGIERIASGKDGFDVTRTYDAAMQELLAAITGGGTTSQDIREGLRSARLAIEINECIHG